MRTCAAVALLAVGCFRTEPQVGGESHFMRSCSGACGDDLSCVCGVCTKACSSDPACSGLAPGARCEQGVQLASCGSGNEPARVCDLTCTDDARCMALGPEFSCMSGRCRDAVPSIVDAGASSAASAPVCDDAGCVASVQPLVMLLVDSSGSMEFKEGCSCASASCVECLPDCTQAERSRWAGMLEALTGTFQDFGCTTLDRTAENGATYDLGYYLPSHALRFTAQAEDGILDEYRDRVRFGLATFDSNDVYQGAGPLMASTDFDFEKSASELGSWSYNPERALHMTLTRADGSHVGEFRYPNCDYDYTMDTGIKGPQATEGGVMIASDPGDALNANARIQSSLLHVRPYGGTPIAASLEDTYYYLWGDLATQGERANAAHREVILITDGYPDDDYRSYGCDCAHDSSPDACQGSDPSVLSCPYPLATDAARLLRCGAGDACDSGVAEHVHVIGLAIDDSRITDELNTIASSGGTDAARFASDSAGLRRELANILDEIAQQQN